MKTPANKSTLPEGSLAAWLGWDWADKNHDLHLETSDGQTQQLRLPNDPGRLHQWLEGICARFPDQKVAVCLEATRAGIMPILKHYPQMVPYLVNPKSMARFREVLRPAGSKSDRLDAKVACRLVKSHAEVLHQYIPQDELTLELDQMNQIRRTLVDERTRLANQLGCVIKEYFPLALALLKQNTTSLLAAAFILRFPTLKSLQGTSLHQVRQFFIEQGCRLTKGLEQRLQLIAPAQGVTNRSCWNNPKSFMACSLARQLKVLIQQIDKIEERISILLERHPNRKLVKSLPGAGAVLQPRLAVALGTSLEAAPSSQDLAVLSGIAPVQQQSGNNCLIRHRWAKPQFTHQTWIEFAKCSTLYCQWAKAFVEAKVQKGRSYFTAIRALAFKWMRIIHACWKANTVYDEAKYLAALKKQNSSYYRQSESQSLIQSDENFNQVP